MFNKSAPRYWYMFEPSYSYLLRDFRKIYFFNSSSLPTTMKVKFHIARLTWRLIDFYLKFRYGSIVAYRSLFQNLDKCKNLIGRLYNISASNESIKKNICILCFNALYKHLQNLILQIVIKYLYWLEMIDELFKS